MIEILVVRDPDSADDISVWQDGHRLSWSGDDYVLAYVDAGAGYSFEDWRENADYWLKRDDLSDEFQREVAEAFYDPPGQTYIEGFKELAGQPFMCRTCGRIGNEEDLCELGEECPADDCDGTIEHNWKEPD